MTITVYRHSAYRSVTLNYLRRAAATLLATSARTAAPLLSLALSFYLSFFLALARARPRQWLNNELEQWSSTCAIAFGFFACSAQSTSLEKGEKHARRLKMHIKVPRLRARANCLFEITCGYARVLFFLFLRNTRKENRTGDRIFGILFGVCLERKSAGLSTCQYSAVLLKILLHWSECIF